MPTIHICDKTCQVFARVMFLAFIIIIAAYFFWVNDKIAAPPPVAKNASVEKFIDEPYTAVTDAKDTITAIYMELYSRPPNSKELAFYTEYAADKPTLTKQDLKNTIATTSPVLAKSLVVDAKYGDLPNSNTGKEYIVIEIYNELLGRNPESDEIAMYSEMLVNDKNFTENKMRQIILSSEEYRRMEMTQNNMVYSSLPEGITDRQLTMKVKDVYEAVTGKNYVDEDTLRFLKKKYLEMSLDDARLKVFIERYVKGLPLNDSPAKTATAAKAAANGKSAGSTQQSDVLSKLVDMSAKAKEQFNGGNGSAGASNVASASNVAAGGQNPGCVKNVFNIYGPNQSFLESIAKNVNDNEDIFDSVKCATSNVFDKNALSEANMASSTAYTNYLSQRNRDYLGTVCKRNQEYRQFDNESFDYAKVLDYSANNRYIAAMQMGTFSDGRCKVQSAADSGAGGFGAPLDMAQNTKVGSILPPIPPTDPM